MTTPYSLVFETPAAAPEAIKAHYLAKLSMETDPSDVRHDQKNGRADFLLLDVRARNVYVACHASGAQNLPYREISEESTADWPKDRLIVVYCWSPACNGGAKAALRLAELGFQVKEMLGGIEYWRREGFPVEGGNTAETLLLG
ncbi:rhodanese-like domain-containing protein [Paenibacillus pasadenensis]|uniref:rhodanese-like domain-containing protein n=1 Tax=Paenibacillus pasadenensis TaxID=217090 RepID=UPI0020404618|nr:rhodanese-like domain-containing protein [Paenibacillus pasadenensis]MCM3745760.1 rhodanese-like domain-containing protein [Paenibacillus pasadenensis]